MRLHLPCECSPGYWHQAPTARLTHISDGGGSPGSSALFRAVCPLISANHVEKIRAGEKLRHEHQVARLTCGTGCPPCSTGRQGRSSAHGRNLGYTQSSDTRWPPPAKWRDPRSIVRLTRCLGSSCSTHTLLECSARCDRFPVSDLESAQRSPDRIRTWGNDPGIRDASRGLRPRPATPHPGSCERGWISARELSLSWAGELHRPAKLTAVRTAIGAADDSRSEVPGSCRALCRFERHSQPD